MSWQFGIGVYLGQIEETTRLIDMLAGTFLKHHIPSLHSLV